MSQEIKAESEQGIYSGNGDNPFPIKRGNKQRKEKKAYD
jgi:hypothetical protein